MIGRAVEYIRRDVQEAIQYSIYPLKVRQEARRKLRYLSDEVVRKLYDRNGMTVANWIKELSK